MSGMLQVENIHKRFGKREVLQGISMQLQAGEVYGLLGPNGAGKSTTLRVITGLVRADRGSVKIDGVDLGVNRRRALARVGAQVDSPSFYGQLSGRQNLARLAALDGLPGQSVDEVLAEVGLSERADEKAGPYSTGMKQRLALAATLLARPALLILDEPTSGLDPDGRESMLRLVRSLAESEAAPTVLFTSHIFDEVARLCDRVGILVEGRIAHEGPVEATDELRERYFSLSGGSAL